MSIKKYDIEIPKLDYYLIRVGIYDNNGQLTTLGENDLIFMTVGLEPNINEYKFQKSLENGISYNPSSQKYEIVIDSSDTSDLEAGVNYGYDITIYYDGNKPRQKAIGGFKIGKKFTLNEVS